MEMWHFLNLYKYRLYFEDIYGKDMECVKNKNTNVSNTILFYLFYISIRALQVCLLWGNDHSKYLSCYRASWKKKVFVCHVYNIFSFSAFIAWTPDNFCTKLKCQYLAKCKMRGFDQLALTYIYHVAISYFNVQSLLYWITKEWGIHSV